MFHRTRWHAWAVRWIASTVSTGYFTLRWFWSTQAKACPVRLPWSTVIARRLRLQYLHNITHSLYEHRGKKRDGSDHEV
ncbi:hypothetical protein DFH27DRAFT_537161 [Peziza echinospora]|nr:hypothetical protein DFH27DRAFT_537161 [Peziza echinospora]